MPFLTPAPRARRRHEWSHAKAVTFIVTLAATRSVTLAAQEAGMSRKSAYALKARDPAFAMVWNAAAGNRIANEVKGVDSLSVSRNEGDARIRAASSISSISSIDERDAARLAAQAHRDRLFASLARLRDRGSGLPVTG